MHHGPTRIRHLLVTGTLFAALFPSQAFSQTRSTDEPIDYLEVATDFADCMIQFGRDRYGDVHSPLFAVLLTREPEPTIGPQPYFDRSSPYDTSTMKTPFRLHDFNRCLNYPAGIGGEGPHKVTLFGCDPGEDRALYVMLIDLGRITGNPEYRRESEAALRWWFTNTLGPADLYPWGEHLGWDFENECPTYFQGPSKHLYAACYHEIKDDVPFLDFLATLPSPTPGQRTPLERYALGVWNAHYWDQQRCIYCRHGDYTGQDDRKGSLAGFPAHQSAHLRLWVKTRLATNDPVVRRKIEAILNAVLDVQTSRAEKHGFIPFTFDADHAGGKPVKSGQSDRLARHAVELSVTTREHLPGISTKLETLARLLLGEDRLAEVLHNVQPPRGDRPKASVANISKANTPDRHAKEILRRLQWYRQYGDAAYLQAAGQQARIARGLFCDAQSPLPKAYSDGPRTTTAGKPFPDFYFRGARLMHAFALLGEAQRVISDD